MATYIADFDGTFPSGTDAVDTYRKWAGKVGSAYTASNRLLNPYVGWEGPATATSTGALEIFHCPKDNGTEPGAAGPASRKPSDWDVLGWS